MDVKPTTVLIAEDNVELGIALERILHRAGFVTERVLNGKQVLDFCATHSPDTTLLLLDYRLGDLTAKEVVQRLKKQNLQYFFIIMTGFGNEGIAVEMMKLGAADYLVKSGDLIDVLIPVISRVMTQMITRQSLERTQQTLQTAHQAIMAADNGIAIADLSDADCPITYYNPAFETITGYPCSCRPTLREWLNSYDPQQPGVQKLQTAVQHHKSTRVQLNLNPNYHKVNLCFTPETPERQGTFIAIVTDITQEQLSNRQICQLRQQLDQTQHLAIIGQTANELAHEIGQPLTHISSIIQSMISKNSADPDVFPAILKHIDRITNLLRSFSSEENNACSPTKLSIGSILESVLQLCPYDGRIHTSADTPEDMPEITADKAKIIQVLLNLITNAKEACEQDGTIHLSSDVRTLPETGKQYAAISVKDNGCGIEPENLHKIFDPFFSTKSKSRGRGLGLPICQNIAHLHRGWIDVESQPGQGSCFTLVLPLEPDTTKNSALSETDIETYLRIE